jgi:hypothetical protein
VTKIVDLDGYFFADNVTVTFTVNVTGPSYPTPNVLTFHVIDGVLQETPITLNNLILGTYHVVENNPGIMWDVTGGGDVNVVSGTSCASSTITNTLLLPATTASFAASAYQVSENTTITLYIADANTGDVPLTDEHVHLYANGVELTGAPINSPLTESSPYFTGGDITNPGVIDVSENWTWQLQYTITGPTTFMIIGHGTDPLGFPVDAPDYPSEQVSLTIEIPQQGCTPGFWKENAVNWNHVAWVGYTPDQKFSTVFSVAPFTINSGGKNTTYNPTLLQALQATGSGINLLARSAVAALLNASNPNIDYPLTTAQVISLVQAALAAGNGAIQALGEQLDDYNNLGCSINQQGLPIMVGAFLPIF